MFFRGTSGGTAAHRTVSTPGEAHLMAIANATRRGPCLRLRMIRSKEAHG
jgi:hypothetical protein